MAPCRLHCEVSGPAGAPALLLGPSLGTTAAIWTASLDALAREFRVLRYDHRGHGASPAPPGPYEIEDLAGDVLALLDRHGIERASYCGISLGGMVGMWLAAHAPERIDRLVLTCTSAYLPPASGWAERAAKVRAAGTTEVVADAVIGPWLTPPFAAAHPEIRTGLRAMLCASPAEGYAACCGVIERLDLRPALAQIAAPTLVIAAAGDAATPPEHGRRIAAAVSGARIEILPDAAHLANVERPAEVGALIAGHCRSR